MADRCRIRNTYGDTIKEFSLSDLHESHGEISIGRSSSCAVSLKKQPGVDTSVGRDHLHISRFDDQWWLTESENKDKIYKNGHHIRKTLLQNGDEIRFGKCTLIYGEPSKDTAYTLVWEDETGARFHQPLQKGLNYVGRSPKNDVMIRSDSCAYYQGLIEVTDSDIVYRDIAHNKSWKEGGEALLKTSRRQLIKVETAFAIGGVSAVVAPEQSVSAFLHQSGSLAEDVCRRRSQWLLWGGVGAAVVILLILGFFFLL